MKVSTVKKPGVILLSYYYHPQVTSGVQRADRLAKYLPEYGLDVRIVASSHEGCRPDLKSVEYVPGPTATAPNRRWQERLAHILRRVAPYDDKFPWVMGAVDAAEEILARDESVIGIISTSPPVGAHLAAWMLKRRHPHLEWIADFRDPILGNPTRSRQWAFLYDRLLEKMIFGAADRVVAVSDEFVKNWRRTHHLASDRCEVIWNGFDPAEQFGPLPIPAGQRRVVLHAGVLYKQRYPATVLTALGNLTAAGKLDPSSLVLRFLGPVESMKDCLALPGSERLIALGCLELDGVTVSRPEAMRQIAMAGSLFLIDVLSSDNIGYTVPAKIFDYLLTGRPILAVTSKNSPVDVILSHSGVPHVAVYPEDEEQLVEAKLLQFFALSVEPVRASPWFYERFDGRKQAAAMARLFTFSRTDT